MPTPRLTDEECFAAVTAFKEAGGNQERAADILSISRSGIQHRLRQARKRGLVPKSDDAAILKERNRALEALLKDRQQEELTAENIRRAILNISKQTPSPPEWLVRTPKNIRSATGAPTLFLSDLHWGEVVDPSQVAGMNEYNIEIAQRRLRTCVETAIDLLKNHMVRPRYPGIILALGGDMVTGDIHEELTATNEMEIMPTFVDLFGVMIWAIDVLADQFGAVFLPCVTGNHGRNTKMIRAKGRNFTSFDWLLYVMLERHFAGDKRVSFCIPNGSDALYRVYGHRYLLTHGDQFRGGDGMIGPLGPITRGDHKKRSRNSQVGQDYDTALMGHWHTLMQLRKFMVNGSLKGYCEYAYVNNFPFEPPAQALWMTHPEHGVTFSMPVYVERKKGKTEQQWVSLAA